MDVGVAGEDAEDFGELSWTSGGLSVKSSSNWSTIRAPVHAVLANE